jgi:hypothetical protein
MTPAPEYWSDLYNDPMYIAAYLTTHWGIYDLHIEQCLELHSLMGLLDMIRLLVLFLPLFLTS